MSGAELSSRLEPNELRVARAIYGGAAGDQLFADELPPSREDDPWLPKTLRLLDPTPYVLTVLDGVWCTGRPVPEP
jgi:hypothetical protein